MKKCFGYFSESHHQTQAYKYMSKTAGLRSVGCYTALFGIYRHLGAKQSNKMGWLGCSETSVKNYQSSLCNIT
jgi:hypothetical protein